MILRGARGRTPGAAATGGQAEEFLSKSENARLAASLAKKGAEFNKNPVTPCDHDNWTRCRGRGGLGLRPAD